MALPRSLDRTVVIMEYQEVIALQEGAVMMTQFQMVFHTVTFKGAHRLLQAVKDGPSNCKLKGNCQHGVHTMITGKNGVSIA